MIMSNETRTYREWRVTATTTDPDMPDYDFIWSPWTTRHICATDADAEAAARSFVAVQGGSLTDLELSSRTITVTPWSTDEGPEVLQDPPDFLPSLIRSIDRMRTAGVEPVAVAVPALPGIRWCGQPSTEILGLPVVWVDGMSPPYILVGMD
jgi:hypothetical protein